MAQVMNWTAALNRSAVLGIVVSDYIPFPSCFDQIPIQIPTHQKSMHVLDTASEVSRDLYRLLEETFVPLDMCTQMRPLLDQLSLVDRTATYVPILQKAAVVRLLKQVRDDPNPNSRKY